MKSTLPFIKTRVLLHTFFVLAALALAPQVSFAQEADHSQEKIPLIKMGDVPLTDAIKNLATQGRINCVVDPRAAALMAGKSVTTNWSNVKCEEAMDSLLKDYKLKMVTNPATTVGRIVLASQNVQPVPPEAVGTDTNRPLPSITLDDVPLRDTIVNVARQALVRFEFDPSFETATSQPDGGKLADTKISVRWTKITAKQALAAILDNYDLVMEPASASAPAKIKVKASSVGGATPEKK